MKKAVEIFVGIDVSKAWLDIAVHEQKEITRFSNDEVGIASLVKALKKLKLIKHGIYTDVNWNGCGGNRKPEAPSKKHDRIVFMKPKTK